MYQWKGEGSGNLREGGVGAGDYGNEGNGETESGVTTLVRRKGRALRQRQIGHESCLKSVACQGHSFRVLPMGGSTHMLRLGSIYQLTWSVPSQVSVPEQFLYPMTRRPRSQGEKVWR